jgi:hypothetical protein
VCRIQTLGSQYLPESAPRSIATVASPPGNQNVPVSGNHIPVHSSHSATVPVILRE